MAARFYHIGGLPPRVSTTSSVQNFQGRLQGLVINGERILDEAHLKQIEYEGEGESDSYERRVGNFVQLQGTSSSSTWRTRYTNLSPSPPTTPT